jgi:hypothetical protein
MSAGSTLAAALITTVVASTPTPQATLLLRLQDPALVESSGLAVSQRHDGILWTHGDGGVAAQVRAVDRSGQTVAVVTLAGIDPFDPEALAPSRTPEGPPQLWLADIGDNGTERVDVSVFRFAEPTRLQDQTVEATWYRFAYPDGPHDAEALLVHPRTGRLFLATKGLATGGLYRAPSDLVTHEAGVNRLERVRDVPFFVTDGAFLPDGRSVLRTYSALYLYDRAGDLRATVPLPAQPQGESVAVDGDRLLVGSEGVRSGVYAVPLPGRARTTPTATAPSSETDDHAPPGVPGRATARLAVLSLAAGVAGIAGITGVVLWLRHRRR